MIEIITNKLNIFNLNNLAKTSKFFSLLKIEKSYLTKFIIFADKNELKLSNKICNFFKDIDNFYKKKKDIYIWYGSLLIKPLKLCELNKINFEITISEEYNNINIKVLTDSKWFWLHSVYNISDTNDKINCVQKYFLYRIFN